MQELFFWIIKYSGVLLLLIVSGIALISCFNKYRNGSTKSSNYSEKKCKNYKEKLPKEKPTVKKVNRKNHYLAVDIPKSKSSISDSESSYNQISSEDDNHSTKQPLNYLPEVNRIEDDMFSHGLQTGSVRIQHIENFTQTEELEKDVSIQADIIPKVFSSTSRKPTLQVESLHEEDYCVEYLNDCHHEDVVEWYYNDGMEKNFDSGASFASNRSRRFDEDTFNEVVALQTSDQRQEINNIGCLEERAYRISRWLEDGERSGRSKNCHRDLPPMCSQSFSGLSNMKIKDDSVPRFYSDEFSEDCVGKWVKLSDISPVRKKYNKHFIAHQNHGFSEEMEDRYKVWQNAIRESLYPGNIEGNNVSMNRRECTKYATPEIRKYQCDRMYGIEREIESEECDSLSENNNYKTYLGLRQLKTRRSSKQQNHVTGRYKEWNACNSPSRFPGKAEDRQVKTRRSSEQHNHVTGRQKEWNVCNSPSRFPDKQMKSTENHYTRELTPSNVCSNRPEDKFQNTDSYEEHCLCRDQSTQIESRNLAKLHSVRNSFEKNTFEVQIRRENNEDKYHANQNMDLENSHHNNDCNRFQTQIDRFQRTNEEYYSGPSKENTHHEHYTEAASPEDTYKFHHPKNDKKFTKTDDTAMKYSTKPKSPTKETEHYTRPELPVKERKRLSNYLKHQHNNLDEDTLKKSHSMVQDLKKVLEKRGIST